MVLEIIMEINTKYANSVGSSLVIQIGCVTGNVFIITVSVHVNEHFSDEYMLIEAACHNQALEGQHHPMLRDIFIKVCNILPYESKLV